MKAATLLFAALAVPCLAQFQSIELTFEGVGCKPCIDSLPERLRRIRGVESASVDAERGVVSVRLAAENRVRIEQIRDFLEQDGTKTRRAVVRVAGELRREGDRLVLQPPNLPASYFIVTDQAATGRVIVTGTADDLRPASGTIAFRATEVRKPD
jgi:copper chaperone CopZ